jgi:hypothetical protein
MSFNLAEVLPFSPLSRWAKKDVLNLHIETSILGISKGFFCFLVWWANQNDSLQKIIIIIIIIGRHPSK